MVCASLILALFATEPAPSPAEAPSPAAEPAPPSDDGIPDLGSLDNGIPDLGTLDAPPGGEPDSPPPTPTDLPELGTLTPPPPPMVDDDPGERFGDIFTGSLRLTSAFLHFDDTPALFPDGDDALVASVFRVIAKRDVGRHVGIELNYFLDLSRRPDAAGGTTGFSTAGTSGSVYRSPLLQGQFWDDGSIAGQVGADRFVADVQAGPVNIAVGRFPVSYTVAGLLTPNDFFAPFSASAVNRIYKPGVDAVRIGAAIGMRTSVEVVGVMGNDDDGDPTWGRSGLLARAATVRGGFEWAVLGGKVAERWVAGGSSQGDIGPVSLRGEGHVGLPDSDGDGRSAEDREEKVHVRLAAGPSVNIGWRNVVLGAEYAFLSDGAADPEAYLRRALRRFPDDQPQLGRHYLAFNGNIEIVPVLNSAVFTLVNANDGSGLLGTSLVYNVADEADIIAGVFAPWGADAEQTDDPEAIVLGSEYGVAPLTVYLEARAFF